MRGWFLLLLLFSDTEHSKIIGFWHIREQPWLPRVTAVLTVMVFVKHTSQDSLRRSWMNDAVN